MKIPRVLLITYIILSINLFANDIATITALKGEAQIKRNTALLSATLGDKLKEKDNIFTKNNTKLQIIFKDETIINLGKNSELSIAQYLFEDKQEPIAKFSMLRGAMRAITGQIGSVAPQKFSVLTKTATIGIRGTNFSIFVEDDGSSSAFCTYGAITVTISGITHLVNKGFYISISPQGISEVKAFSPKTLKEKRKQYFTLQKSKKKTNEFQSKTDDFGSLEDALLDITFEDNFGMVIDDVSNNTQSTVETNTNDLDNNNPTPPNNNPTNAYP